MANLSDLVGFACVFVSRVRYHRSPAEAYIRVCMYGELWLKYKSLYGEIPLTNRVRGPYRKLRTEKTRLVRYLLYLCCVSKVLRNDSYSRGAASNF